MRDRIVLVVALLLLVTGMADVVGSSMVDPGHWPQWRGPLFNGIARTGAPVEFSDTKNVKWKVPIAGRGFSTPVIWGDRIVLTTAVPTGKTTAGPQSTEQP